eukprot:SM000067S20316  [mRNA]  locus=s67:352654:358773:+ [translate_table: standard]
MGELGVPAAAARATLLFLHPLEGSRLAALFHGSEALLSELRLRVVAYDRPGCGQSDPDPGRTLASEAALVAELADALDLGPQFYVLGWSVGGAVAWSILRHLPERLAGAALVSPIGSYWWRTMTNDEAAWVWGSLLHKDRLTLLIARHAPALLARWLSQRLVPLGRIGGPPEAPPSTAGEAFAEASVADRAEGLRQGVAWSSGRDLAAAAADWGFDPSEVGDLHDTGKLTDNVHLWAGGADQTAPLPLHRYIFRVLPWLRYHELPMDGHLFAASPARLRLVLEELVGAAPKEQPDAAAASSHEPVADAALNKASSRILA